MQEGTLLEELVGTQQELVGTEGLAEVGVGPGIDALQTVVVGGAGGDDDDGDVVGDVRRAQLAAELKAVGVGHHHVGDDEVGHVLEGHLHAHRTVGGVDQAEVVGHQAADVVGHVGVVLDDEDERIVRVER